MWVHRVSVTVTLVVSVEVVRMMLASRNVDVQQWKIGRHHHKPASAVCSLV